MNRTQIFALGIWKEGLGLGETDMASFSNATENDFWELYEIGKKHSLLSLMYEPLERMYDTLYEEIQRNDDVAKQESNQAVCECIEDVLDRISAVERPRVLATYHLWYEAMRICGRMRENGVIPVVLKGPAISQYYPMPEFRKSGDIDIYIPFAERTQHSGFGEFGEEFEKASRILEEMGYHRSDDTDHPHHVGFVGSDGLEVELHGRLCAPFRENLVNERMEEFSVEIEEGIRNAEGIFSGEIDDGSLRHMPSNVTDAIEELFLLDRYHFPVLSEADNIYYNILHTLSHFTIGGCGWKFLCDFAMMFRDKKSEAKEQRIYTLLERSKLLDFAECLADLSVHFLGLPKENVAFLISGEISEETYLSLVPEIFAAGEFGDGDNSRMVRLEGSGIPALVREFHYQMKLNYPRASRYILIWPVLWLMTLIIFIKNNKTVRGVSTLSIIRNARSRAKSTAGLKLFQR